MVILGENNMKIRHWILAALSTTIIGAQADVFVVTIDKPHETVVGYAHDVGWTELVQDGVDEIGNPIMVANPVTAAQAALNDAATFLNMHLARFGEKRAVEQADVQKKALVEAARASAAQGVTITVQE